MHQQNQNHKPNIIFVMIDCARADHFSCYGYEHQTTPAMDKIAEEGTLFEQMISPAAWTLPSHASTFTGTHIATHKARDGHPVLSEKPYTLADVLRTDGYTTAGFTNVGWLRESTGLTRGFESFVEVWRLLREKSLRGYLNRLKAKAWWSLGKAMWGKANITNKLVKSWLAKQSKTQNPFFLFVHYIDCHVPYEPPRPYDERFLEPGMTIREAMKVNQDPFVYLANPSSMGPRDLKMLNALYDGALAYLDAKIGELIDHFKAQGILDDSILIITADHGENLGEHGLLGHQWSLYDTVLHVPFIIRYPAAFEANTRVAQQVQTLDVFPTILDILGQERPEVRRQLQGQSLLPEALAKHPRAFTVAELATHSYQDTFAKKGLSFDTSVIERELRAIRTNEYKYIWASNGKHELYNLLRDPRETDNLVTSHAEKARELEAQLFEWLGVAEADSTGDTELSAEDDQNLVEHLRALGYMA